MIITHASMTKIENVIAYESWENDIYRGCLFFSSEGNTYNLTGRCNFQYNLEVHNVLEMRSLNYKFDYTENETMTNVFDRFRNELELDVSGDEMSELFDNTLDIDDYCDNENGVASWLLQQYQGILAHNLGFDCAESDDEQGVVYIVYCVGRELEEITL